MTPLLLSVGLSDVQLTVSNTVHEGLPFVVGEGEDGAVVAELAVAHTDPAGQLGGDLDAVVLSLGVG